MSPGHDRAEPPRSQLLHVRQKSSLDDEEVHDVENRHGDSLTQKTVRVESSEKTHQQLLVLGTHDTSSLGDFAFIDPAAFPVEDDGRLVLLASVFENGSEVEHSSSRKDQVRQDNGLPTLDRHRTARAFKVNQRHLTYGEEHLFLAKNASADVTSKQPGVQVC